MDEDFALYSFIGEILSSKVDDIFTHFGVTWNGEASVDAATYVTYREG